ncbi:hypothetical protein HAP48_0011480 [Bradyrhizobium septentrionale]|uniref:Uncharacterized protein n=1 Tax=Bradyrhizobium septentrionale TaxID=1404411 RepID=A0A973W8P6_9BRAD|nr:hypothetical protein [Bradyrhizobium septentrionale]UGY17993.1 hypothetical protein HAP48_0011480 [Bradyrhizobium septentrionale]
MVSKIDVGDLIAVLIGVRRERYAYEKHIALMTFATWLQYPNDQEVLQHAQIVAAAACFLDTHGEPNRLATVENLAIALLASPLNRPLLDVTDSSTTLTSAVTEIVSFFLCCPATAKPSLNKALFFIEGGGFDHLDLKDNEPDARSLSTLKMAWKERACTGPFHWALAIAGLSDLYEMLPDNWGAFRRAERILKKPEKLAEYFGISKFVQERLLSIVDASSRNRFNVKFPKRIRTIECEFTEFDESQLTILRRYRAPKFMPD